MKTNASRHLGASRGSRSGIALVIVLAFVVLLSGLVLALLTRSASNGLISGASANVEKTNLYGQGAIDQIIGDLRQEIVAGSTSTNIVTAGITNTLYRPTVLGGCYPTAVPYNAGGPSYNTTTWTNTMPNLVKESVRDVPFYPSGSGYANAAGPIRSAALSSTNTSLNGRSISLASWNEALLLPKQTPASTNDFTPVTSFYPPDWILTTLNGSNPTALDPSMLTPQGTNAVVGRYSYVIYNEGGLLDVNVAGGPAVANISSTLTNAWAQKASVAFADLTQLPTLSALGSTTAQQVVDNIAGWRTYTSSHLSGSIPSLSFANNTTYTTNFIASILGSTVRGMSPLTLSNTILSNNQSDQMFTSRQHLIQFFTALGNSPGGPGNLAALQNTLQYLGTFSRSLNQPSYWPDPTRPTVVAAGYPSAGSSFSGGNSAYNQDSVFNPIFRSIRVGTQFPRHDGTTAHVGDPLVNKRFPLSRLCWITYKGPSATLSNTDPLITTLLQDGVPQQLINEGTAANIQAYFGLTWAGTPNTLGGYWVYNHSTAAGSATTPSSQIDTLAQVATAQRDPDFFEILKAAAVAGGVAKPYPFVGGTTFSYLSVQDMFFLADQVDFSIMQIGANIIDQASVSNYPTTLVFNDSANNKKRCFWGTNDLPYLYSLNNVAAVVTPSSPAATISTPVSATTTTVTNPGTAAAFVFPVVWDPYASRSGTSTGTPYYNTSLNPQFLRICVSNFSISSPSTLASSPNNYYYRFFTGYKNTANPAVTFWSQNPASGAGTSGSGPPPLLNAVFAPWGGYDSTGTIPATYDSNKGCLDMPADGANGNTAIMFNNPTANTSPDTSTFREPTALLESSALPSTVNLHIDSKNLISIAGTSGLSSSGISEAGSGSTYLGFLMGTYAIRFEYNDTNTSDTYAGNYWYTVNVIQPQNPGSSYGSTVSLEYSLSGANGPWVPYRQYIVNQNSSPGDCPYGTGSTTVPYLAPAVPTSTLWYTGGTTPVSDPGFVRPTIITIDPRSQEGAFNINAPRLPFLTATSLSAMQSAWANLGTSPVPAAPGSFFLGGASKDQLFLASFANQTTGGSFHFYDADGMIRRAMGAYVPPATGGTTAANDASTTIGLPMATVLTSGAANTTNAYNRPVILHRPFRTVGELGYVFSDMPWRNLDLSTPESPYAPLLDAFCINEDYRPDALEAGRVDLNGRQAPVFQAILMGSYRDEVTPAASGFPTPAVPFAATDAQTSAQQLVTRTYNSATAGKGPLLNVADLVGRWISGSTTAIGTTGSSVYDGFSADMAVTATDPKTIVERFREAPIRALSAAGQAGTWNLLIDVIVQNGIYPANTTSLSNFIVQGQKRYWVHVAIDRQTAQVIDEKIEAVDE